MSREYQTKGLSKPILSNKPMNERLRDLVSEKVIILEFPRDTRWECCVLDMVIFRNLDIFSHIREGFTAGDVHHLGTYEAHDGEIIPVIYLKADRERSTLSKKEMKKLIEFMER